MNNHNKLIPIDENDKIKKLYNFIIKSINQCEIKKNIFDYYYYKL